jgi:hypothetical protein
MVKSLKRALDEAATLPEADQEQIGHQLLEHIEKLRQLRADIDKGLQSLDAAQGQPLDVEAFLKAQRHPQGRR